MKKILIMLSVLALISFQACKPKVKPAEPVSPEKAREIRIAVINWMECEECTDNELDLLLKQGKEIVPTLAAILSEGPSPAKNEELRIHLETTFDELMKYAETHPESKPGMAKDEYINLYMSNYKALYQSRAIIALSRIDSKEAREALEKAEQDKSLREDVRSVISKEFKK